MQVHSWQAGGAAKRRPGIYGKIIRDLQAKLRHRLASGGAPRHSGAMEHGVPHGGYKDMVLFLATAGIVVPLFQRLKVSPVLGFLGAGVLLGPYGLGGLARMAPWLGAITVDNPDEVAQLAEFGVVFLLFMIGLELSWDRLRLMRRLVFGLGAAQLGLCAAAVGGIAVAAGLPAGAALTFGAALALSSTAIVLPV